ncbi:hypothetical protein [Nocardia tengchongensis]|uniref:hypothetical protein n=1 Tax=Nocardia tengchongensis TaxID=2055889 RepID=UPI00361FCAC0
MKTAALLAVLALPLLLTTSCGSDDHTAAGATTPAAALSTSAVADPLDPGAAVPAGVSCADIGGVFEKHGTDGRGSCVPADKRAQCHVPPGAQDAHYVADFEMTPPFPTGTVSPTMVAVMLDGASNPDCWKIPAN